MRIYNATNEHGEKFATTNQLGKKQDVLIAGENITIEDNVISSTGGGGGSKDNGTTQKSRMIDVFARKFGPPDNADPTIAQGAPNTGNIYRIPSMVIDDKGNRHFFADHRRDGDQNPIETVYKRYNGQGEMEVYKAITPRDKNTAAGANTNYSRVMDTSPLYLGGGRIIVLAGRWTDGSNGWTDTSGTTMQKWYGVSITETDDYGDTWDNWVLGSQGRTVYGETPSKYITFDNVDNVSGIVGCLDRGIIWPNSSGKWGWICQYVTTTDGSIKAGCLYTEDDGDTFHFKALTDIVGCVSGEGHALFGPDGYIYFMRRCQNSGNNNCDCWKINADLTHAELFDKLNNKIPNGTAKCGFEYFVAKNCRKIVLSSAPTVGGSNRKYLTTYVHMIEGSNPSNAAVPMFRVNYTTAEGGICVDDVTAGKNVMGYSQIIHHATADSEWLGFLYESNEGDGHMVKYMDMGDMIQDISNAMDTGITLKQLQQQGGGTPLDPEWLTNTVMDFVPSSGQEHWETPETLVVTGTGGEYADGTFSKTAAQLDTANAMLDFPAGTNKIKFTYKTDVQHPAQFIRLARDPNTNRDVCIPICVGTGTPYWLINSLNCHSGSGVGGVTGQARCDVNDLQNVVTTTKFGDASNFAGTIGYDGHDGEEVTITVEYSETQVKISSSHSEDTCVVTLESINGMSRPTNYADEKMAHYKDAVITPGLGFYPFNTDFDITKIQMSSTSGRSLRTRVETLEQGGGTGITAHGDNNIDAEIANSVLAVGVKSGSALETLTRKVRTLTTESIIGGSNNNNSNTVSKIRIGRYYMTRLKGHGDITSIKIHFRDGYSVSGAYMQVSYNDDFSSDTYMSTGPQNIAGTTDITFQFTGIPVRQLPLYVRFFTNASGTGNPLDANYNLKTGYETGDNETAMWCNSKWNNWIPYATLYSTIVTDVVVPTPLQPETLIRSNGKYSATVSGNVDYSGLTMEPYARAEIWMQYLSGTPTWPSDMVWLGGEPTWAANNKYFISLVYDGVRIVAKVTENYEMPSNDSDMSNGPALNSFNYTTPNNGDSTGTPDITMLDGQGDSTSSNTANDYATPTGSETSGGADITIDGENAA